MNPHDDPERDAWLSEALRHAPDARAAPPAALSDAILRQARAAAKPVPVAAAPRRPSPWAAAWDWLARPPVAAGFASVMVATLVGVMWWDQPIDQSLERPSASNAAPPAAPTASPAAPVETPAPVPAPTEPPAAPGAATDRTQRAEQHRAEPQRMAPAAPPKPTPAPLARSTPQQTPAPASAPARGEAEASTRAAAPPPPTAPARERSGPEPFRDDRAAAESRTAPAPATAVAPAPAAPTPAPPAAALRLREAAPGGGTADAARDEARSAAADARAGNALAKSAAPAAIERRAERGSAQKSSADAPPTGLAGLAAAIAAEPERWTWQRNGAAQPMSPALQRWLARADRATAPHWGAGPDAFAPARTSGATTLRLYRDGTLAATVQLDDAGLRLGPAAHAPLAPVESAALRQALDAAAP